MWRKLALFGYNSHRKKLQNLFLLIESTINELSKLLIALLVEVAVLKVYKELLWLLADSR